MGIDRRGFLKLAGISTIAGLGGFLTFDRRSVEAALYEASPDAKTAKRWGMAIDMSKFGSEEDYKKCIEACHNTHNVPDFGNPKDEIKWIWTDDYEHTFPGMGHEFESSGIEEMKFLLLCNHCQNPSCVRVCPTQATFKRPDGIVIMDFHRCIGCRFCMAACPFGARSFNWRDPRGKDADGKPFIRKENPKFPTRTKGVVEKCNFCAERLAQGQIPACVEAAGETKALVFGDLDDPESPVRKVLHTHYTIRRKAELGTGPNVFYVIGGK